ncbi:hypothetical protein C8R47DRAFT_1148284 [Mycena vitilis]|nr:hypothetical protein C8R47DRAFT_1148284 [Mycena vitilis]
MPVSAVTPSSLETVLNVLDQAQDGVGLEVATLLERVEFNDICLFGPRFDHYKLEDRHQVWSRIVKLALPDGHNNPVLHAKVRGDVASLCRASLVRTYNDESLWSSLYLNHNVLPDRIYFVLDKCRTAPLRIRLALIDICIFPPTEPDALCADCLVDRIFSVIEGTSVRWKSFYLHTEHPGAFLRVQAHCRRLSAPNLHSLSLSYGHMPGYSEFALDDEIYDAPLANVNWFGEAIETIDHLELQSVYFVWSTPALFRLLTTLDISNVLDVDWDFFQTLFSTADNLRFLRLDSIERCVLPFDAYLFSESLVVLDLGIDGSIFMTDLLYSLHAPNLVDLTLRDIGHRMYRVIRCGSLLRQLTRFAVFGLVLYNSPLDFDESTAMLFDSLSNLKVLDLHNTRADMFAAYRSWTYMRGGDDDPVSSSLEALYVGYTPVESMLTFLVFHGVRDFDDGSHMTLQFVRMRALPMSSDREVTSWFRTRLVDFAFLDYHNRTVSALRGPAYHSLCCFTP